MLTLKGKNIGQFDPPLQFFNSFSLLLIIVNHLSFLKIEQRLPIPVKLNPTKMRAIVLFSHGSDNHYYYMAESVFAMRLVNLRSVTCYTDQNFKENAHFGALNLFTSEKRFK